jgi:hypothetical protein
MTELLGGAIPAETRATCDDCAMCKNVEPGVESFNPAVKCCTYVPVLANFLVGQVLADPGAEAAVGRASVEARIARRTAVTPLGLSRSTVPELLYRFGSAHGFGHSRALLCPHYIDEGGGRCGIWRHRNGVCSTWFCKHDRGEIGAAFWQRTQELLSTIEEELAQWCVLELGIGHEALARLFPAIDRTERPEGFQLAASELDDVCDPAAYTAMWGSWEGRESDFFRACAGLMGGADFVEVMRRCGPETGIRAELVRAAWQRLSDPRLPEKLRPGQLKVIRVDSGTCRVTTYSGFDPFEMPSAIFEALHYFEGRTTEEARTAIGAAGGPALATGFVRKMVDFGVLVPAEEADVAAEDADADTLAVPAA